MLHEGIIGRGIDDVVEGDEKTEQSKRKTHCDFRKPHDQHPPTSFYVMVIVRP
jgi:hypothetical protein